MRSASCYTNKVRVTYAGNNTKVQYPGNVAKTFNIYYPALGCSPNFSVFNYVNVRCDVPCGIPAVIGTPLYTGGDAQTESVDILSGGNEGTESTTILSGGNA